MPKKFPSLKKGRFECQITQAGAILLNLRISRTMQGTISYINEWFLDIEWFLDLECFYALIILKEIVELI